MNSAWLRSLLYLLTKGHLNEFTIVYMVVNENKKLPCDSFSVVSTGLEPVTFRM